MEGGEDDSADMEPVEEEFDLADVLGEDVGGSGSKEDLLRQAEQELEVCKGLLFTRCCPVCFPALVDMMPTCKYLHNWTHGGTMLLRLPWSMLPPAVHIVLLGCCLRCDDGGWARAARVTCICFGSPSISE